MSFDTNIELYIGEGNSHLESLHIQEEKYDVIEGFSIYIDLPKGAAITNDGLQIVRHISNKLEHLSGVSRVDSLSNYLLVQSHEDMIDINPVHYWLDENSDLKELLAREDPIVNRLTSNDYSTAILNVGLNVDENRLVFINEFRKKLDLLVHEVREEYPSLKVYIAGPFFVESEILELGKIDTATLLPITTLIIFIISVVAFRSIYYYLAIQVVVIMSVVAAYGLGGWIGFELSNVSIMASLLIMVLATADTMHIAVSYKRKVMQGQDKYIALEESIAVNFRAIVLTTMTTLVGFLSLVQVPNPEFVRLSIISSIGIFFACVFSFTVFPYLLLKMPVDKGSENKIIVDKFVEYVVKRLTKFGYSLSIIFFCILFLSLPFIVDLKLDNDPHNYFSSATEIGKSKEYITNKIGGVKSIELEIDSGIEGEVSSIEFYRSLNSVTEWLKQQPEIIQVYGYVDVINKMEKAFDVDVLEHKGANPSSLINQLLLTYELSLPQGYNLNEVATLDKTGVRVQLQIVNLNNVELLALEREIGKTIERNFSKLKYDYSIGGMDLAFASASQSILKSLIGGFLGCIVVITLIIVAATRSWVFGIASLLPNIFAPILVYCVWAIFNPSISVAGLLTFTICIGIVVDDTLHILVKYIEHRKKFNPEVSMSKTLSSVGSALVLTTVIFSLGFSVFSLSDFNENAYVGIMLPPMIISALLFDIVVFSRMLVFIDKKISN